MESLPSVRTQHTWPGVQLTFRHISVGEVKSPKSSHRFILVVALDLGIQEQFFSPLICFPGSGLILTFYFVHLKTEADVFMGISSPGEAVISRLCFPSVISIHCP